MTSDVPPLPPFHLTARPWSPAQIPREAYLRRLENLCRFLARNQAANGAIIDPLLGREHQYATPYFACAVAVLLNEGTAADLKDNGLRAMDHATACFAGGSDAIPDRHGEFFATSLAEALELYRNIARSQQIDSWSNRLAVPREDIFRGPLNNWRTYAMRGEWLRARLGLVPVSSARDFIEKAWRNEGQRLRIVQDRWNLYQDRETDPESHAVEAVGRVNILALVEAGYDGPSAPEMRALTERATAVTLLLQDPSGQCPPNGRADNHIWNDALYQLAFEILAERKAAAGQLIDAGRYRRAAELAFQSIARWQRNDKDWVGSFYITKNHFDPRQRVGYQEASNCANYNASLALHLAQAVRIRQSEIPEQPTPAEIGGFALETDKAFASVVANAGGMQLFAALRGDTRPVYGNYWTPLGILRFGRSGWDSRLGPSDGLRDAATGRGISFAPTWLENGQWVRMADVPERYQGYFSVSFAHPLVVRCVIDYRPRDGHGPLFHHELILTPDGVLATLRAENANQFGVTWPLLENDGTALHCRQTDNIAATAFTANADEQCFILVNTPQGRLQPETQLRGSYGWLRPLRAVSPGGTNTTFVYPRSPGDPSAETVRDSFQLTATGFRSALGEVRGTLYIGRTSAGGDGTELDLDGDGHPEIIFGRECRFIVQKNGNRPIAIETDRDVLVRIGKREWKTKAYQPLSLL